MSKPDLFPKLSTAGITVDPRTLERVIPESRRPDGTVRKQIRVRPGFTPQEDVSRFRGTRQAQMDATSLPKGHVIGWTPPQAAAPSTSAAKTKSAKKNEKRKEKRKAEKVKDDWEDDDDDGAVEGAKEKIVKQEVEGGKTGGRTVDKPNQAAAEETEKLTSVKGKGQSTGDELVDKLVKLDLR